MLNVIMFRKTDGSHHTQMIGDNDLTNINLVSDYRSFELTEQTFTESGEINIDWLRDQMVSVAPFEMEAIFAAETVPAIIAAGN